MGSCLSSSNYSHNYYDNRHYESYCNSRIENRIQYPSTDEERAEIFASRIENTRIQQQTSEKLLKNYYYESGSESEIESSDMKLDKEEAYEEVRKQAEFELGYADDPREITSQKFQKIREACWCKSFHILYHRRGPCYAETWECAHVNESDWRKSKFGKLCEDCQVMLKFCLYNEKVHRLYLDDDMNIFETPPGATPCSCGCCL